MLKKIIISGLILILLALDWAALHDILKGNETDYLGEYLMLTLSLPLFIIIILAFQRKRKTVT